MFRSLAVALALVCSASTSNGDDAKPTPMPTARQVRLMLDREITLDKEIAPNTPLKDALELLLNRKEGAVPYHVDTRAFESIGIQKVEEQPVELRKKGKMRLKDALDPILKQLKGDLYTGDWSIREGKLEITTSYHRWADAVGADKYQAASNEVGNLKGREQVGGPPPGLQAPPDLLGNNDPVYPRELLGGVAGRLYKPVFGLEFDKVPLKDAMKEIAEATSVNIVIDPRLGEKASAPVSGRMNNIMVDTAVRILADMAEVSFVLIDGSIYITTAENAAKFYEEAKKGPAAKK